MMLIKSMLTNFKKLLVQATLTSQYGETHSNHQKTAKQNQKLRIRCLTCLQSLDEEKIRMGNLILNIVMQEV